MKNASPPGQPTESERCVAREKALIAEFLRNEGWLPADMGKNGKQALIALGVVFLSQDNVPPKYVRVFLPQGWKKVSAHEADHRLLYLVDTDGRVVARIFHKDGYTDQNIYLTVL